MNVLITGGCGFIARNLCSYLSYDHLVYAEGRQTLNLLDKSQCINFSENHHIDTIIHAAIEDKQKGWPHGHSASTFYNNISMFENAITYIPHKLFINIASGAEFDKEQEIVCAKEEEIYKKFPRDFYGSAKNIIAKRLKNNGINLRLFNCFGFGEAPRSLVINAITKAEKNEPIHLLDKWMDFFYIGDLCRVVNHLLTKSKIKSSDINCVYSQKHKLVDVVKIVQKTIGKENEIKITEYSPSYTGNGDKLALLNLPLMGLNEGIKEMIQIRAWNQQMQEK
ncbi:MAG: NAD-dependent epimerase/dehydratase family protein [Proteobacteria bacterium]|jgi:nucleoside-diphosphate-sugar epimerase|nr:NAD-dependent epimerase/dehydratase family protein [Pseudomonadota bacterium]